VARHVLATLVRVLSDDARYASVFHRLPGAPDAVNSVAYADFFRLLAAADWFAREKALFCLAKVIEHRPKKDMGLAAVAAACGGGPGGSVEGAAASAAEPMGAAAQTVVQLTQWLCAQLARPSHASRALPAVVSALAVLLAVREARALVTHSGGVRLLGDATRRLAPDPRAEEPAPHDVQALYESTLCLWFLTFHPPATREMARSGVVIPALMDVARTAAKEKVARAAVLALSEIVAAAAGGRRGRGDADAPRGDAGDTYRRVRVANPAFRRRAGRFPGAMDALRAAGFRDDATDGEPSLRLTRDDPALLYVVRSTVADAAERARRKA